MSSLYFQVIPIWLLTSWLKLVVFEQDKTWNWSKCAVSLEIPNRALHLPIALEKMPLGIGQFLSLHTHICLWELVLNSMLCYICPCGEANKCQHEAIFFSRCSYTYLQQCLFCNHINWHNYLLIIQKSNKFLIVIKTKSLSKFTCRVLTNRFYTKTYIY